MAVYEYEILGPDGTVHGIYEAEQKMTEPALTHHPQTGEPLRRILSLTFAHSAGAKPESVCSTGTCGDVGGYDFGGGGCAGGACGLS
jgi:hypothetical protein